jgi:hypothetical protein
MESLQSGLTIVVVVCVFLAVAIGLAVTVTSPARQKAEAPQKRADAWAAIQRGDYLMMTEEQFQSWLQQHGEHIFEQEKQTMLQARAAKAPKKF